MTKSIEQKFRELSKAIVENNLIVGKSEVKITWNKEGTDFEFELLNPFRGCECGEAHD